MKNPWNIIFVALAAGLLITVYTYNWFRVNEKTRVEDRAKVMNDLAISLVYSTELKRDISLDSSKAYTCLAFWKDSGGRKVAVLQEITSTNRKPDGGFDAAPASEPVPYLVRTNLTMGYAYKVSWGKDGEPTYGPIFQD